MTNINTIPRFLPCPFARDSDAAFVLQNNSASDTVDIENGLKPSLDGLGAMPFARGAMNGMLNLATQMPFYLQCGGYLTFDEQVSRMIGGYPKGAVLSYVVGKTFGFVISMKDNNTDNFVDNPAYIDGKSWYMSQARSIFPDYRNQILPSGNGSDNMLDNRGVGKNWLAYFYPYAGNANTIAMASMNGHQTYVFDYNGYKGQSKITGWIKAWQKSEWEKQCDTSIYFRVIGDAAHENSIQDPPETFNNQSVLPRSKLQLGAQIYLHERGWFYLSLARIVTTMQASKTIGNYTYVKGVPNCAMITLSDTPLASLNEKGTGYQILSSSYAPHTLTHQSYAWTIQLLVRRKCYLQIWTRCPHFDMFYNYFKLKE